LKRPRLRFVRFAASAAALGVLTLILAAPFGDAAWSQTTRSIKIIVPYPPGGNTDILARLIGERISRAQGSTVLIENRPGAGTVTGTEVVARAAPDGNTLLISSTAFVINPLLRKMNYDPLTSFEPICNLASVPTVIVVNAGSPYRTLADLLDAARAKPGDLTLASTGPASSTHIAFEMLKHAANVNMTYLPYAGNAPAVTALLGGHVTSLFADYTVLAEHLAAGKLRALATASRSRIEPLPHVPTVAESGYKDVEAEIWNGLLAPAKTPKETTTQLDAWLTDAMQVPEVRAKVVAHGFLPVGTCGADFSAFLRKQYVEFGCAIRESNIKGE
jgi:tripartite-type tricarboxylate transporter receptor subunit TctC